MNSAARNGSPHDVVVVGAGAVGVAIAYELASRGASVTVLERGAAPAAGCSAGNAGIVGPSHVEPLASGSAIREGLQCLVRPTSAFGMQPQPALVPWLARFVAAARPRRRDAIARVLEDLASESYEAHLELGERLDTGLAKRGFLGIYETPEAFAAAREHAGSDPTVELLDADATRATTPALAVRPAGGILSTRDAHCDPERFVSALAAAASDLGVRIRTGVEVLDIRRKGGRAISLFTTAGDVPVGTVVIAAGVWSGQVAASLPITVPLQGGKGYHLELERSGDFGPPVYFPELRIVATPLEGRLRVTGMLQLAGTDLTVDQRRVAVIASEAARLLGDAGRRPRLRTWRGLRPCTPDGLPLVGPVPGAENVVAAFGHGQWGLQLSPVTGRLVADLIGGRRDPRLDALSPERFGMASRRRFAA
ncbi:MAG: FAD-binding oxidoreductase [Patulibacter sp.]|nr:FAD-binding oxidoreductase [Patulibacter sp.]